MADLPPCPSEADNAAFQDTDDAEAIMVLAAVRHCANSWDGSARLLGNVRARDISRVCTVAIHALTPLSGTHAQAEPKHITDEMIENGCRGMYGKHWDGPKDKEPGPEMKKVWREYARKCLASALSSTDVGGGK